MQKEAKIETSASAALSDYDAIANTVQNYSMAAKSGRTADMKLAFHRGRIDLWLHRRLICSPAQSNDSSTGMTRMVRRPSCRAVSPTSTYRGTVATVRSGARQLDRTSVHRLFTLLKMDGEWKIMNKVFHLHPEN